MQLQSVFVKRKLVLNSKRLKLWNCICNLNCHEVIILYIGIRLSSCHSETDWNAVVSVNDLIVPMNVLHSVKIL